MASAKGYERSAAHPNGLGVYSQISPVQSLSVYEYSTDSITMDRWSILAYGAHPLVCVVVADFTSLQNAIDYVDSDPESLLP